MSDRSLDLSPYQLFRPQKIRWMYDTSQPDFFATLKSKSLTHFLKNADDHLSKHRLTLEHLEVDEPLFDAWFNHYVSFMTAKKYDIIATKEWFLRKAVEGKKVGGFFISQDGVWQSTLIYTQLATEKAFASYKTSLDMPGLSKKHVSLGALIDYYYLQTMLQQNIPYISLGSMRNAFGVTNTLGNLDYKLRYGYLPTVDATVEIHHSVPLAASGSTVFFAFKKESPSQLQLCVAHPQSMEPATEFERFKSDILAVEYLPYAS